MLGQLIASCTFVDCLYDVVMCSCAENKNINFRVVVNYWLQIPPTDMFSSLKVTMFYILSQKS